MKAQILNQSDFEGLSLVRQIYDDLLVVDMSAKFRAIDSWSERETVVYHELSEHGEFLGKIEHLFKNEGKYVFSISGNVIDDEDSLDQETLLQLGSYKFGSESFCRFYDSAVFSAERIFYSENQRVLLVCEFSNLAILSLDKKLCSVQLQPEQSDHEYCDLK